ncbi:Trans-aconitate 2-methyltransferase [Roseomonas sp. CECT 9278]|nr:Trans-aconitate 2-methyltransferase [Roseomonas sp. CECT 9278]
MVALEIGAQPVLGGLNRRILPGLSTLPSIARDTDEAQSIQRTTASLWTHGTTIDWDSATDSPHHINLPAYVWARERHWDDRAHPLRAGTTRAEAVGAFYDDLAQAYAALTERGLADPSVDLHLTYAPFPEIVPGFSWLEAIRDPGANPAHLDLMLEAQRRLRRLALRRVDLSALRRVFDLGCGYGGDLVALARRYPRIEAVGHTASARQAEVAARLAASRGVGDRVTVHHRDSTQHAPDGRFDLVLGFEAVHHMADPAALFAHLRQAIAPGGHLVLADLMATGAAIADGKTLSDLPAAEDWAGWLASAGLRLEDATCVSPAIANFLHDPGIEAHVARIGADLPVARRDAVQDAFRGFVRLGRLLREGGARYLLFSARRTDEDAATLRQAALDILAQPTPFAAVAPEAWLYEPRWVAAPAAILPAPAQVATAPAPDPAMPALAPARAALDRLARAYAAEAAATPPAPDRTRAARRLAQLAEAAPRPAAQLAAEAIAAHPEAATEIALLARCGDALPAILRGEAEALPLLFAGDTAAHLYAEAPSARRMNGMLAGLLRSATAQWPAGRRLRVLEVGAGTGGTTAALREALPADADYLFTDVSPALLAAAPDRFPGIRTAVFDAERAPAEQGLRDARFDIIVAANALHACRDIPASLAHLSGLLAPGGWIALLEATAPAPWVDATFGLTPGWWRFDDALRHDHPLLAAPAWEAALTAAGLADATTLRPPEALLLDQAVIVARRPPPAIRARVLGDGPLAQAARAAFGGAQEASAVLDLRALDRDAADVQAAAADALALLRDSAEQRQPVWLVTRGAVATRAGEALPQIAGAPLWGLGLVAALEQPEAPCRLLDLDPRDPDPLATLRAALAQADDEDRTAWRDGERLVQRLERRPWPQAAIASPTADGAWLITGGRGGLGLAVAEHLAAQGVTELVLAARSAPSAEALALAARLRAAGVSVALPQADVASEADVAALVASITARTRLAGVVHAAGVLDDAAIHAMSPGALARVMAPKACGALHLDAATRDLPAHRFVLFSSVAGVLGNAGQANHAAASATLDALAWQRRAQGLHALAIDWGAWAATGAAAARGVALPGVTGFAAAQALDVLDRLLAEDATQAMVLPVDWAAFAAARGGAAPLLREMVAPSAAVAPALPQGAGVPEMVAALAAQVLGMPALPDRAAPLAGYGFDSLMAIALRNRIREAFGVDLPLARLVGGASADALAAEIDALRAPTGISADVAAMSDDEVEAALRALAESPA